jgi:hypothetical protein
VVVARGDRPVLVGDRPAISYLLGTRDRLITATTQRFLAERAQSTIVKVKAGHLSMISNPAQPPGSSPKPRTQRTDPSWIPAQDAEGMSG